jgi:tRNA A37 threonylcarbamoyladenosine synthetase subunit TsaC/SUA5/YrdC
MLLHIHPDNPNPRHIKTVVECLLDGGVIIYPTDTIYGLGCDIFQHKAIEKVCKIKNIDVAKATLENAGFNVVVENYVPIPRLFTVYEQDPAGGSMATPGTTIILRIV